MKVVSSKVPDSTRTLAQAAAEEVGESLSMFTRRALQRRAVRVLGGDLPHPNGDREGHGDSRD